VSSNELLIDSRRTEALNCQNCGAPIKIVQGRDYFYCEHCSSLYFPTESRDGVRVLGELGGADCPVCRVPLVTASVAGALALHCNNCRGLLIDQESFAFVVRYLRARAPGLSEPPRPLNPEDLKREVDCPRCKRLLDTHPYYGPGNVIIDVCTSCAIIWLDYCELNIILNAPGRDRR
jgi:Zn-finger nucleic acid-binding protein